MGTIQILLCCGAGMSSGFLANAARKAVKKKKLNVTVEARSYSDVANYMSSIDILMIGPHYAGELPKFKNMADPHHVPVCVIPKDMYALLNGEDLLAFAFKTMEDYKK